MEGKLAPCVVSPCGLFGVDDTRPECDNRYCPDACFRRLASPTGLTECVSCCEKKEFTVTVIVLVKTQRWRRLLTSRRFGDVHQSPQRLVLVLLRRHRQSAVALFTGDGQNSGDEP